MISDEWAAVDKRAWRKAMRRLFPKPDRRRENRRRRKLARLIGNDALARVEASTRIDRLYMAHGVMTAVEHVEAMRRLAAAVQLPTSVLLGGALRTVKP